MLFVRPDQVPNSTLYVVTSCFNPARYRSRWRTYADFALMVERAGGLLYTVEVAFSGRDFVVTQPDNPRHLQLRTTEEIWTKEASLNLLIQRLPSDWAYCAWIDADIAFIRPDWVNETVQQLQHYQVVQMFSRASDVNPNNESIQTHKGMIATYLRDELDYKAPNPYHIAHPGYAWAARREAIDTLGGLFELGILGGGDRHIAMALLGDIDKSYPKGISAGYVEALAIYQARAKKLKKNVGYVPGGIYHFWHGSKKSRQYKERWQILIDNQYDPEFDIKKDWQGLISLEVDSERQIRLRDEIRAYFAIRNEDSIDVG